MSIEKPHTQLYEKMYVEQEQYRQWLLAQPSEEILKHAYEFTIREDILLSLEYNELPENQSKALLKSPCPLSDIFKTWEKIETGHMQDIFNAIELRANTVLRENYKQLQRDVR